MDQWERTESGALIRTFLTESGVRTIVSVDGDNPELVREAAAEVEARLTVSLEEGRFDVRELGVRDALMGLLVENKLLGENLSSVQARATELINKARDWRKKIVALGGEDPGSP